MRLKIFAKGIIFLYAMGIFLPGKALSDEYSSALTDTLWMTGGHEGNHLAVGVGSPKSASKSDSAKKPAPKWTTHKNPAGFSVELPPGWRVKVQPKSGRLDITGASSERVVILPFFVPDNPDEKAFPSILKALAKQEVGDGEWESPQAVGKSALRMTGKSAGARVVAAVVHTTSARGAAGFFYATSAPETIYTKSVDTFARILKSFRIKGAPPGSASAVKLPAFVQWQDPRENAFSLQVPKGWSIDGGMFRFATVDIRAEVTAVSPDGKISLRLGDKDIPLFTEPNPTLAMAGFHEGSLYSPGYGVVFLVKRYLPGVQFAEE